MSICFQCNAITYWITFSQKMRWMTKKCIWKKKLTPVSRFDSRNKLKFIAFLCEWEKWRNEKFSHRKSWMTNTERWSSVEKVADDNFYNSGVLPLLFRLHQMLVMLLLAEVREHFLLIKTSMAIIRYTLFAPTNSSFMKPDNISRCAVSNRSIFMRKGIHCAREEAFGIFVTSLSHYFCRYEL